MPKPQTVLCYICGREFGSYSINVHERQCAKRWESQKDKEKESAEKRKTSQVNKEKLQDPWVKRDPPSTRLQRSGASKSMVDIRLSNDFTKTTENHKEFMHALRPITATLGKEEKIDGDVSSEENNTADNNKENPKVSRPLAAVLSRYSSPLLPNKIDPTLLRKHSAPTPICNSPDSSTSSQISSTDSQDLAMGTPDMPPPRFRSSKNPNLLICYICGNEFGSKSLKIHEPQCLKKWKLANPRYYSRKGSHGGMFKAGSVNSLHGKENGFQPRNHQSKDSKTFKSASCENLLDAGTTGTLRSTNSLQALKELSKSQGRLYQSTKPKMEPCYICGKEFIKHSIAVHEKQCKKKWDAIKIKNEKEQKKLSNTPKRHSLSLPVTIQVDKVDDMHNNNVDECQNEPQGKLQPNPAVRCKSKERKYSVVTCYLCGRSYGSASISIHEKQCQKKWEAESAQKAKEQVRPKSGARKTKPRPRSFVL